MMLPSSVSPKTPQVVTRVDIVDISTQILVSHVAVLVPLGAQLEAVCLQVAEVEAGPVARDVHAPAAPQRLPVQVLRVIIIS